MLKQLLLLTLLMPACLKAQDLNFVSEYYTWPDHNKIFTPVPDSLKNEGAVILNDDIQLNFPEYYIKRRQSVKILDENGLSYFKTISLPQSFDITKLNNPWHKQGRFSKRLIPYIHEFKITYFAARIIRNKTIIELPVKMSNKKVYWVQRDGERIYDYEYTFSFDNLEVNDIIEYTYKADIRGSYDTDQFYVNDYFPKLNTDLIIKVHPRAEFDNTNTIFNHNIDSLSYKKLFIPDKNYTYQIHTYNFKNLKAIKYSQNSLAGKTLPHITASIYSLNRHHFNTTINSTKFILTTKYSWLIIPDSLYFKERVYDKYGANLRKFLTKFPENTTDTTKTLFLSQVIDTINSLKYLSSEHIHYSSESQYALNSSERLLKHQLLEEFIGDTYCDILFEKNVFYYKANVQDRRLGFHSTAHRTHEDYELEFIALPVKNSYKFYLPRFCGIKYFPDELPFYYEGTYCALIPKNTKAVPYKDGINDLKFIKTPISTYNENVRTENAVFKINIDSLLIHATIKENLNGQFSTILRHFYNKEYIDSTVKTHYFKKCVEKPNSTHHQIKLSSQSKAFPFKTSYNCTENITIKKNVVDLSNWFSFIFNKECYKEKITQDFYFDFTYTDTYNFMFEFNKPVTISNITDFNKSLSNEFFEISSIINKQDDTKYLFTVTTKAKQYVLPEQKANYLTEYIAALDQLNSLKLNYTN